MKIKSALILSLMLVSLGAGRALADEARQSNGRNRTAPLRYSKIMGTVESVDTGRNKITVKDKNDAVHTIPLNNRTKIYRKGVEKELSQIETGSRVAVRFHASANVAKRIDVQVPVVRTLSNPQ